MQKSSYRKKSRRRAYAEHRARRIEQLEARCMMTASSLLMPIGDIPGGDFSSSACGPASGGQVVASTSSGPSSDDTSVALQESLQGSLEAQAQKTGAGRPGKGKNSPGISLSPITALQTTEGGGTATVNVVLDSQPTADVTIGLSSSAPLEGVVDVSSLVFTTANWNEPQAFTVTGVDDAVIDGDIPYTVMTAPATSADANYNGLDAADVTLTNLDDDAAVTNAIYVSSFTVLETQRGRQTYYSFEVEVRYDIDGDNIAEESDPLVPGATVVVSIFDSAVTVLNNDSNIRNFLGTTNNDGVFRTSGYKDLESGKDYSIEVWDVALDGFVWDPSDLLETDLADADHDRRPDLLLAL